MDVVDAIRERKAFRAFKSDPVPLDILKKIMEQALRAPSWANTQPWEFAVATGKKLKEIQEGFVKKGMQEPYSEVARPYEYPEPYMSRIRALAPKDRKEMTKEEMEARTLNNFRHYGASTCIYLLVGKPIFQQSRGINVWSLYDCGSAVQNIMLLATNYGLGTVAQAQAVIYPDIIRKVLGIPEDKLIALGIAIGYPDLDNPINKGRTAREPLDKVVKFYGF
ncbi:MAG TPA: nitroreductase [Dehalococcoidales bacterium]|nr:nitroreductase [Dehalococcoidales bacterium]